MVALTSLQWVLIVAAGSITTAGVGVGIWLVIVRSSYATSTSTTPTTLTTTATTTTLQTTNTTTSTTTTTRSTTKTSIITSSFAPTTTLLEHTYDICGSFLYFLISNGRYLDQSPAFIAAFKLSKTSIGVPNKYACCSTCGSSNNCKVFQYKNSGECKEYVPVTIYNGEISGVAYMAITLDGGYSVGFYLPQYDNYY